MKIHLVVEDDHGNVYEGTVNLIPKKKSGGTGARKPSSPEIKPDKGAGSEIDFSLQARAFVKKYDAKSMTGTKKFVLLLAWMTKGAKNKPIIVQDLIRQWNKMTEPMGGKYNGAYPTRAKTDGWIDLEKTGSYRLRSNWQEIFRGK